MNTPLKFNHEKPPDFQHEGSDFRAHYVDVAAQALVSIWRHRRRIASLVALALAVASIFIPLMPRKYSAEALIYPNLFFSHEQGKAVPLGTVDAASMVTSEARLIRSDAIVRAVVKRLGLDPMAANSRSWATQGLDWIRVKLLPETRNHSPFDRTVAMLRNKVTVTNDTRSYLISISFTATSADQAARVVNAFAIEYLRDKDLQRRRDAAAAAHGELGRQLAIYGEKHPNVLQAGAALNAARAALSAAMNPDDADQNGLVSNESVKLAIPNRTPTSPKGFVILGVSFILALLAGIGLAVWHDRMISRQNVDHRQHPRLL
ncbi:hypothetical protein J6524_05435 [Bradyrhizobium sp. WSM 1738]|uniref:hypothetical protein n=1 Tax=Bradyrhizobium hereditatis TaxID=2821405 RepID=UPI001CE2ED46|nr:hypothetical protein [Bradyrhizobium hereditatis]MCA6114368.1 hypothetical protein [Bradyrhizobium hereditatis]